jgi:transposase
MQADHFNTTHHMGSALPENKLSTLSIAPGRGAKVKLEPVAELLPALVEKYSRNLKPILDVLEKEHSIQVSKVTLKNFLKGVGL